MLVFGSISVLLDTLINYFINFFPSSISILTYLLHGAESFLRS